VATAGPDAKDSWCGCTVRFSSCAIISGPQIAPGSVASSRQSARPRIVQILRFQQREQLRSRWGLATRHGGPSPRLGSRSYGATTAAALCLAWPRPPPLLPLPPLLPPLRASSTRGSSLPDSSPAPRHSQKGLLESPAPQKELGASRRGCTRLFQPLGWSVPPWTPLPAVGLTSAWPQILRHSPQRCCSWGGSLGRQQLLL